MRKLLDSVGINGHRNLYALRHTFETIGGQAKDQVAVDYIMGHARDEPPIGKKSQQELSGCEPIWEVPRWEGEIMGQSRKPGVKEPKLGDSGRMSTNGRQRPAANQERLRFDAHQELAKLSMTQRQMLPQSAPTIPGYELQLSYRPAYLATGDYHDFFNLPDGCAAAFVGDGAGHGPSASVLVATMRAILQTHPELHGEPGNALTKAGRYLHALFPPDRFMTGIYLQFGKAGRVCWASAGQGPPLRVSRQGRVAYVDQTATGFPMGIEADEVYETVSWQLIPGERLLLFTDGLVEARSRDGEPFGRDRLRASLGEGTCLSLGDLVRQLLACAASHRQRGDFEDDITILGVERREGDERKE
jgi:serine phosphatase RsbU (regulator of sigma subunit)